MEYYDRITKAILDINHFLSKKVTSLEELLSTDFTSENLDLITTIMQEGNYKNLGLVKPIENLFGERLTLFSYYDELDQKLFVLFYDANGLYDKPVLLKSFRCIKK